MQKSAFQQRMENQMASRSGFHSQFNKTQRRIKRGMSLGTIITLIMIICWLGNIYKLAKCDLRSADNPTIVHAIGIIPYACLVTVWFPVSDKNDNSNKH